MNDIYRTPLLTFWPLPFTLENLKECFDTNKKLLKRRIKNIKNEVKNKTEKPIPASYFLNLFSTSY